MAFFLRHAGNLQHADIQCGASSVARERDDLVSPVFLFVDDESLIRSALAFREGDAEAVGCAGQLDCTGGREMDGAECVF